MGLVVVFVVFGVGIGECVKREREEEVWVKFYEFEGLSGVKVLDIW